MAKAKSVSKKQDDTIAKQDSSMAQQTKMASWQTKRDSINRITQIKLDSILTVLKKKK